MLFAFRDITVFALISLCMSESCTVRCTKTGDGGESRPRNMYFPKHVRNWLFLNSPYFTGRNCGDRSRTTENKNTRNLCFVSEVISPRWILLRRRRVNGEIARHHQNRRERPPHLLFYQTASTFRSRFMGYCSKTSYLKVDVPITHKIMLNVGIAPLEFSRQLDASSSLRVCVQVLYNQKSPRAAFIER